MNSLAKYAFLNALLRAKLSAAMGPGEFDNLLQARDPADLAPLLDDSDYRDICPLLREGAPLGRIEKELVIIEISLYRSVLAHASGVVKGLISTLMEIYDVEKVEGLLRLWTEKAWDERDSIIHDAICFEIPVDDILKAASMEEIILLLRHTPFQESLMEGYPDFRRTGLIFHLETALERGYYGRLGEAVGQLGRTDRTAAERMLGVEVDIRNIEIIMRLKRYSALPAGELRRALLPGGLRLSEQILTDAYSSNEMRGVIEASRIRPLSVLGSPGGDALEKLRFLRSLLEQALVAEARRALGGYPFTIGTVIAYFIIRRVESRALRRIIAGKFLGLSADIIAGGGLKPNAHA